MHPPVAVFDVTCGPWSVAVRTGPCRGTTLGVDEDRPRPRAPRARPARRGGSPPALDAQRRSGEPLGWTSSSPGGGPSPADPTLAHDSALHRPPVTTLDDHLARGLRVEALAELVDGFVPRGEAGRRRRRARQPPTSDSGRRSSGRHRCATSTRSRATSGRCGSGAAARCPRPGTASRSSTSATCRRSAGRTIRSGRRRLSVELDYELEVAALVDTPARDLPPDRAEEAIGGYTIFNDWSARDLQRDETAVRLGPAKGKDFASSFGPWLVTPDELADARAGRRDRARTWR